MSKYLRDFFQVFSRGVISSKVLRVACVSAICLFVPQSFGTEKKPRQKVIVYLKKPVSSSQNQPTILLPGLTGKFFKNSAEYEDLHAESLLAAASEKPNSYGVVLENQQSQSYLEYQIIRSGRVRLNVLDLYGKVLMTLVDERMSPGTYRIYNGSHSGSIWNEFAILKGFIVLSLSVDGTPVFHERTLKLNW